MGTKISTLSTASAAETASGFVPIITGTAGNFTTKRAAVSTLGGGGASVTTDPTAPSNPSDGDLWFNENEAELYVYTTSLGAWIQTNGAGGGNEEATNLGVLNSNFSTNAFVPVASGQGNPGVSGYQGLNWNGSGGSGKTDYYCKAKNISGGNVMLIATSNGLNHASTHPGASYGQVMDFKSGGSSWSHYKYIGAIVSSSQETAVGGYKGLYNPELNFSVTSGATFFRNPAHVCVEPGGEVFLMTRYDGKNLENNYQVLTSWMGHSADDWHAAGLAGTVSNLGFNALEIQMVDSGGGTHTPTNISIEGTNGLIQ